MYSPSRNRDARNQDARLPFRSVDDAGNLRQSNGSAGATTIVEVIRHRRETIAKERQQINQAKNPPDPICRRFEEHHQDQSQDRADNSLQNSVQGLFRMLPPLKARDISPRYSKQIKDSVFRDKSQVEKI